MSLPPNILLALRDGGVLSGSDPVVTPLVGGVSCDIWRVEDGEHVLAVKRALPKLRVQAEWFADVARNRHEQDYLRYVARFLPDAVPRVVFSGEDFFAMEFLGGEFSDWKKLLLAGKADPIVAAHAGSTLGCIHRESWHEESAERTFDTGRHFHDLRVAPYLLAAAEKNPTLVPRIRAEAKRLAATKRALVHGDYSPKNLMVAPGRLVVLDCEVAWYGDPAFDLAFLLNHFLLKSVFLRGKAEDFLNLTSAALAAYAIELGADKFALVARDTPALLLCLMLARVDGKSPVEYLSDPAAKDRIRAFVRRHLPDAPSDLHDLLADWKTSLSL